MEPRVIVIIAILVVIIIVSTIYLLSTSKKHKYVSANELLFELFIPKNILGIDFVRNKIVVSFNDALLFDVNKLKEYGGKGITVIGDTVKFYISDKSQENERLYKSLLRHIER
jgi:uncharacterized protein YebE (UPF0316 family)